MNKLIEKEVELVIARGSWLGEGELNEGSQNVQTFSSKIKKYQGCNVQHDKYN